MSRYHSPTAPRCTHNAAIWEAHHKATDAYWQAPGDRNPEDRPATPEHADGYCADCHAALLQPGASWPAEIWEYLNAEARAQCAGSRRPDLFHARKLPAAPKPRTEPPAKHRARLAKAYANRENDGACNRVLGRPTSDGYRLIATNGHCALLELGEGEGELLPSYYHWTPGDQWIDLPPAFHLALTRVALLANERSHAITLTIEGAEVLVQTSNYEGAATERVPVLGMSPTAPLGGSTRAVCLNAEYLDPICGVWPLRWYVQDEMSPQLFAPVGGEYRAVVMPMRN